ncbi:ImmA/IrrE family metallo-endopeptidase [Sebaldella sp. S0638]|uniref:ImmA/IrrE family metallo-endopeptidase n=1 Tax=Sebaldella sp. S0638 TaxID=2957809 RepID=UPI00209FE366|nr:ImmA/IrrE family metallo-endopeptidase [Sebaldella sp. S0638]MCP1226003.1 ImmA/IrrE family metallo-endopeptidase [Sebaldella sp. S0638]
MNKNIRIRVRNLIKKHNTSDPYILCQKLGIIVLYNDLGDLKGYYKHPRGRKIIVINSLLSKFAQIIVLAHELGHAVLHSNSTAAYLHNNVRFHDSIMENEANKFASELLANYEDETDYYYEDMTEYEHDKNLLEKLRRYL